MADKERSDEKEKAKSTGLAVSVEAMASLLKALAWPSFALFVFFYFREPLADLLPVLVKRTSKIEVAGVTVEIDKPIGNRVSPALRNAMSGLSPAALRLLIEMRNYGMFNNSTNEGFRRIESTLKVLKDRGLVGMEQRQPDEHGNDVYYRATSLGEEAYQQGEIILIDILNLWANEPK